MAIERYKRYTHNKNAPGGFMERGEAKKKVAKKMKLSSAAEADREEARKYPRLYPKGYQG